MNRRPVVIPLKRRWKRSDLPTSELLRIINKHDMDSWEYLTRQMMIPPKVVEAAILRDVERRWLNYGVSVRRPWLRDMMPMGKTTHSRER